MSGSSQIDPVANRNSVADDSFGSKTYSIWLEDMANTVNASETACTERLKRMTRYDIGPLRPFELIKRGGRTYAVETMAATQEQMQRHTEQIISQLVARSYKEDIDARIHLHTATHHRGEIAKAVQKVKSTDATSSILTLLDRPTIESLSGEGVTEFVNGFKDEQKDSLISILNRHLFSHDALAPLSGWLTEEKVKDHFESLYTDPDSLKRGLKALGQPLALPNSESEWRTPLFPKHHPSSSSLTRVQSHSEGMIQSKCSQESRLSREVQQAREKQAQELRIKDANPTGLIDPHLFGTTHTSGACVYMTLSRLCPSLRKSRWDPIPVVISLGRFICHESIDADRFTRSRSDCAGNGSDRYGMETELLQSRSETRGTGAQSDKNAQCSVGLYGEFGPQPPTRSYGRRKAQHRSQWQPSVLRPLLASFHQNSGRKLVSGRVYYRHTV